MTHPVPSIEGAFQGGMLPVGLLESQISAFPEWAELPEAEVDSLREDLLRLLEPFLSPRSQAEADTEGELIWPVLERLGWEHSLKQQNLSPKGRSDVPDGLLFLDADAKRKALQRPEHRRYALGEALVESKRWALPLDRRTGEGRTPSTQMLRYLRQAETATQGGLRWGILTNGLRFRLYRSDARSVSEEFLEADLGLILDLPGHDGDLLALDEESRRHCLKIFLLAFRARSFRQGFHARALEEARTNEERVAGDISRLVFEEVFPGLAKAISEQAPQARPAEIREAALTLLYRLLFILYAEDRRLLPAKDARYDDYGLAKRVRRDVGDRKDKGDAFSDRASRYWIVLKDLCRGIDQGDPSIGLPPYNGGLFDPERTPLLETVSLSDQAMANVVDALSFERPKDGAPRRWINYRDLSVQQLGSIYERLLEHEVVRTADGEVEVRPDSSARKGSGSYYTPDDLVQLILKEAVSPLVEKALERFRQDPQDPASDPAEAILALRVCDPAMGSGHFLVGLVDMLADHVMNAMAEVEETYGRPSPLSAKIEGIRERISANAAKGKWAIEPDQLDDRRIVRRMVLKRCVHGVDRNSMAVELAKVSLWLHTFTVGAPLSFLDHHLRCGDSLFGTWVAKAMEGAGAAGGSLFVKEPIEKALRAAPGMKEIEALTDAEISEASLSAEKHERMRQGLAPLESFLSLTRALEWLDVKGQEDRALLSGLWEGRHGDPVAIAQGKAPAKAPGRLLELLRQARGVMERERFLHWQTAFPGVWSAWEDGKSGGFDAVVGNPPWSMIELKEIEWFSERHKPIAMATKGADRKRMIALLEKSGDPLAEEFRKAKARATRAAQMARSSGDYPLLSNGRINLYSLFVERAMTLAKPEGMIGLLTPSGIASDKTAARFFKNMTTEGRLKALYDFENRRTRFDKPSFFPDVTGAFKFSVFVASPSPTTGPAECAFFLQDVSETKDPKRCFKLTAEDFTKVNPNTGTAPIFRSRRDAALTTRIYDHLPALANRSSGTEIKAWPVKYRQMLNMTSHSHLFRTHAELEEEEKAWKIKDSRFESKNGIWLPLYQGRMIHQFDHRAASVEVNPKNLQNPAISDAVDPEQKKNPSFSPTPQYWIQEDETKFPPSLNYTIVFRDITNNTAHRTIIAAIIPKVGLAHKVPAILPTDIEAYRTQASLWLGNLNSLVLDFVTRQKTNSTSLAWHILEQLPVVPVAAYDEASFGPRTAGEIVREAVLELTYTAHDMAPFAKDMGHVDAAGEVLPPFVWDDERRLELRAKLDAVYFHLYGITDPDDVAYIHSTFPIVERKERKAYGSHRSRDLCLAWMNALEAGKPDAEITG